MQPSGRQQEQSLRLAVCEATPEDQEWLLANLRAQGHAIRCEPFRTASELATVAQSHPLDVVIWGHGSPGCSLPEIVSQAQGLGALVVVALSDLDAETFSSLRLAGAADVYLRGNAALATRVVVAQAHAAEAARKARQALDAVAETDRRCDALIDAVADPVAYLNEGLHIRANQAYVELMGYSDFEEMEGLSLLDFTQKESEAEIRDKIKRLGRGHGEPERMSVALASGTQVEMMFSPTHYDGEPCLQVSVARPAGVAVLPPAAAGVPAPGEPPPDLEDWLSRDPASGLYNRRHMLERLPDFTGGFAWLVRLDSHDSILRVVGPTQLDALVSGLGKHLQALAPPGAVVARWTGALVGVLSSSLDEDRMAQLKERLAQEFIEVAGRSFQATVLCGGVALNESMTADQAIMGMDQALGETSPGSPLRMLDTMEGAKASAKKEATLVADVRAALDQDRLSLAFQPIVSLSGGPEAYEVLLRMEDSAGNILAPGDFMPLAASHGLAQAIDEWVLSNAVLQAGQRHAMGKNTHVLVKISAQSLADAGLPQKISALLDKHSVAPEQLWIEIPMKVASSNAKETRQFRDALSGSGSPIVISGFPEDPTAFRLAEAVSPAWIKLARDFVEGLGQSHEKQAALASIMDQAAKGGTRVLVGFVEDAMLLTTLFSAGVDAAQGNFISPPRPKMDYDFSQFGG